MSTVNEVCTIPCRPKVVGRKEDGGESNIVISCTADSCEGPNGAGVTFSNRAGHFDAFSEICERLYNFLEKRSASPSVTIGTSEGGSCQEP